MLGIDVVLRVALIVAALLAPRADERESDRRGTQAPAAERSGQAERPAAPAKEER